MAELSCSTTVPRPQQALLPEERERMEKRRLDVLSYRPPTWMSRETDPVSGEVVQVPKVNRANIAFFGPYGSGKSSLIGSLYRAVNVAEEFPEKVRQTLNTDGHGTVNWLETHGNPSKTIVYQDTRGHQEFDSQDLSVQELSLRGMYRDGAPHSRPSLFSAEYWTSHKFFWERTLNEVPHCVVFVFDGSSDPFLDDEMSEFFKKVFEECSNLGYEPVIVVTCLDLIYQEAVRNGRNYEIEVRHKEDKVLQEFERLHLIRQSIYFVTNFHNGQRGGLRMWKSEDEGFEKVTKQMVDLSRDLLNVADRFINRNYTGRKCTLL